MSRLVSSVYLLALASFAPLLAQTGSLQGRVTDPSGAAVPNATVTVSATGGRASTVRSAADGSYRFAVLPPGAYTVEASAPDLKLNAPVKVTISTGPVTLDLALQVVLATQTVGVQESVPGVTVATDAASNASATVLTGKDLDALADDPNDLAADLAALAGPSAGPNGGQIFVDGFSGGNMPSKDSIREIRINQNPFSPEYEKLGLGRIEILTKPGTGKIHGSAFYNFADDFWNSRNPYAAVKAPFFLREWGGNVGGPLGKKTSFFFDSRRDATDNGSIVNAVTLDPKTLQPTPFSDVFEVPQRAVRLSPRIDHQLTPNHSLTFRYAFLEMDVPGAGVGSFNLRSRGFDAKTQTHTVQVSDTGVIGNGLLNEVRFQYFRSEFRETPFSSDPAILVSGAFSGGGAQTGNSSELQNNYELQDYLSAVRGAHTLRFGVRLRGTLQDSTSRQNFGGTYIFSGGSAPALDANNNPLGTTVQITSLEQYRRTLLFQQLGYDRVQIRRLGGGPTQFTLSMGQPSLSANQVDAGLFVGDEWKVTPKLTLNLGLRYEVQTNISDFRSLAPRVAVAWSPWKKTVLRTGFGMFYDRFPLTNTILAQRLNGSLQQQLVISKPGFFSTTPIGLLIRADQPFSAVEQVSSNLRAPYLMQSLTSIERELPRNTTVSVTYAFSRGVHMLRSRNINAPVPGSGDYPYGHTNPIFLMESSGVYDQNQLLLTVNTKATSKISLTGNYVLNRARSDTDGVNTFPANQYDLRGEYGPASTDVRHRASIAGTVDTWWGIRLNPLLVAESGGPFNILAGEDLYRTTLINARPAFATDPNKAGVIRTPYGLLDPNPGPGAVIVPRNYGRGPGAVLFNCRITKTIALGPEVSNGGGKTSRPYTLAIGMSVRNVLNHNNPGPIIGNITSPLFGQSNQAAGSRDLGGGGFSEAANNRRLELQVRFTF